MVTYDNLRAIRRGTVEKFLLNTDREVQSARVCASQLKKEDYIFRTYLDYLPDGRFELSIARIN